MRVPDDAARAALRELLELERPPSKLEAQRWTQYAALRLRGQRSEHAKDKAKDCRAADDRNDPPRASRRRAHLMWTRQLDRDVAHMLEMRCRAAAFSIIAPSGIVRPALFSREQAED